MWFLATSTAGTCFVVVDLSESVEMCLELDTTVCTRCSVRRAVARVSGHGRCGVCRGSVAPSTTSCVSTKACRDLPPSSPATGTTVHRRPRPTHSFTGPPPTGRRSACEPFRLSPHPQCTTCRRSVAEFWLQGRLHQWAHWARAQGPGFYFLFQGPPTGCGK